MQIIEIGKEEYPLHFGTLALNQYCRKHDIAKLGDLLAKLTNSIPRRADGTAIADESQAAEAAGFDFQFSLDEIVSMFRFAVNSGYRKAGQADKSITEEQAYDLFDARPGLAMEVFALFAQSVMTTFAPEEKKAKGGKGGASKN